MPPPAAAPPVGARSFFALLGASNLAFGLPLVARELAARFRGGDLSIYAARGCGRSYGITAGLHFYKSPGLVRSALLDALERDARGAGAARVYALLTDVGNDILYGAGVESIAGWVREIIERLQALGARIGVTALPVESVEAIPAWKFRLLRPLFYPFRRVSQEEVTAQVRDLQGRLESLGREKGIQVLPARASWYRFDHFHLSRSARGPAFAGWIDAVLGAPPPAAAGDGAGAPPPALRLSPLALRYHLPAEYYILGRSFTRPQPGVELAPGTRLYSF